MSHLLQMRGLKLINPEARKKALVASFTDAWIETPRFIRLPLTIESHLLQMRGLKQKKNEHDNSYQVASFTDAWIET